MRCFAGNEWSAGEKMVPTATHSHAYVETRPIDASPRRSGDLFVEDGDAIERCADACIGFGV